MTCLRVLLAITTLALSQGEIVNELDREDIAQTMLAAKFDHVVMFYDQKR
jgi:hypothetical protein